jgi:hypothetical protein
MSSRARIFAAVTLLVSCLSGPGAVAQVQNLEAGKSPSQLFAGTCNACHKSPRGLLKTVSPSSLSGFLREHYTTSGDMASQLATYLISNGASDRTKQGADKPGQGGTDQADRQGRKNRNTPTQEAARPDDTSPPGEGGRQGRRRQARPGEAPEEGRPVANAPAQADTERGPDGRRLSAKQRSRMGKPPPTEEPSVANEPPKAEPAKAETGTDDKAKGESRQETGNANAKPDADVKPADAANSEPVKSEAAKIEAPKDSISGDKPLARRDSVPAVTPAPPGTASTSAAAPAAASAPAAVPAIASGGASDPAVPRPSAPAASEPPAVTASAPPPAPAGPPAPPISQ